MIISCCDLQHHVVSFTIIFSPPAKGVSQCFCSTGCLTFVFPHVVQCFQQIFSMLETSLAMVAIVVLPLQWLQCRCNEVGEQRCPEAFGRLHIRHLLRGKPLSTSLFAEPHICFHLSTPLSKVKVFKCHL